MSEIIQAAVILVGGSIVLYVTYCVMRATEYDRRVARMRRRLEAVYDVMPQLPENARRAIGRHLVKYGDSWVANELWECELWIGEMEKTVEAWAPEGWQLTR